MTTKTITQLPSASNLSGVELIETVQVSGGFPTSVKTTMRDANQVPQRFLQFAEAANPPYSQHAWQEGILEWDGENHTVQMHNDVSAMRLQIGQEMVVRVKNETGQQIDDGTPCYIAGSSSVGGLPLIGPAKADNSLTLVAPSVATHDIPNGTIGYATKFGVVRDIDTSGFFVGAPLWVSPVSAGKFTNTRPISPNRSAIMGLTLISHAVTGSIWVEPAQLADAMQIIGFTLPLSGVTSTQIPLTGTLFTVDTSATGDVTADWSCHGHHAMIKVNQLTTGGDVVITGDSINESTGVVSAGDSETITVYASAARPVTISSTYYQSENKWLAITNIDVSTGSIVGINYNYGYIGYPDMGNRNFRFIGYRLEMYSDGIAPDIRFIFQKIDGEHGKKIMHVFDIEDIGIDSDSSGNQIIDHIRTGADDRSYNSPLTNLWENAELFVFKSLDLDAYWRANPIVDVDHQHQPNEIAGKTTDSGYIIRLEGEPDGGGISNVQYIVLKLYYELF